MNNDVNMNNSREQSGQVVQGQQMYHNQAATHAHLALVEPVNYDGAMTVTTLQDLQSYSQGIVVRFPDFAEGQPLVARVRRPSMLALAKSGQIPNTLLQAAGDLFSGSSGSKSSSENTLREMYEVCRIVCSACLRAPTMDEIEGAGLELTDEQIMAIFNYTQVGVKALDSFRQE